MTPPRSSPAPRPAPPLVAHVILRLAVGGMENGLVNLINRMDPRRYRHAIVCLDEATDFRARLARDVTVIELGRRDGKDLAVYGRLWRSLRRLRPAIVHTRNLPAVDMVVPAWAARVPAIIHGEHGRDVIELDGANAKYNRLRRWLAPLVDRHVALSRDLAHWLEHTVGVPGARIVQIYNGVDAARFHPAPARAPLPRPGFAPADALVIGTVGRLEAVKDQLTLAHAFVRLVAARPDAALRLVMVGEGRLRPEIERVLADAGVAERAWLAGSRDDVAELMRGFDVFVLPSRNEGISNTILEAMASGLPVVATAVGGNPELVVAGATGALVPAGDADALANALAAYVDDRARARHHGTAARTRIEQNFTLDTMVTRYTTLYDKVLGGWDGTT